MIFTSLSGCKEKEALYKAPNAYYSEIQVKDYSNINRQNTNYNIKIINNKGDINYNIEYEDVNIFVSYKDGESTLINKKFGNNQIKFNLQSIKTIVDDLDLKKFNDLKCNLSNTVEYTDGLYKYVLEFQTKTFSPKKIIVYKENSLYKNYEYKKFELYK